MGIPLNLKPIIHSGLGVDDLVRTMQIHSKWLKFNMSETDFFPNYSILISS